MLDVKWIRDNTEEFNKLIKTRKSDARAEEIIVLDEERRQLVSVIQHLQKARNDKSELIHKITDKYSYEYVQAKRDAQDINDKISELERRLNSEDKLNIYLSNIPNLPSNDIPVGNESKNKEIKKWGKVKEFDFKPKQHFVIGEELDIMDFESAAKISGSRFVILKKDLARLERALSNFMLDIHVDKFQYEEINVPHLVKEQALYNVGQLPKFDLESYKTEDRRLIPTAEVPLTNIVANKILDESDLPLKFVAYSRCFRSEAGSAGKDTRGMIRNHEFSKVELVTICAPENSDKELNNILESAEYILQALKLPYRVILLSTEDMGFSATKTYDIEVWLPGQGKYREISSCSNCSDFQARRMKSRYKTKDKNNKLVHTLNGSALAIGRTIIAIIENYQNSDGSVNIPEALVKYMGGKTRIEAKID